MPSVPTVVVIDDDAGYLRAFGRVLAEGGFNPALYRSLAAFLASPPEQWPRCIVLDIWLSDTADLDLERYVDVLGTAIPVIVTTAFEDESVRAKARQLGCMAYFEKSADVSTLLDLIRSC